MILAAGDRLGPYEIVAPIGSGGMGEVYKARDTRLGREVAVKVLPAEFSTDPERLRRFEQEARSASALNHPNILAIFDVGTHGEAPYVVSELLDGETLRERLAGASLPVRKATDYATQIAEGLAAAQEKGIVHRDLKPENLFVTKDGRIKILDFGLAKLTRPEVPSGPLTEAPTSPAETEPGVVMGTVGYMSPEQVRGQTADHRSDIFAFGAILYEMLTGRRAFRGTSAADTMSAILKEEPEFAPAHPDASPALEHIVRRCLEKSPQERFQSARDLAFALRESSSASAASQSVSLPVPRSRSILWLGPLGLVALLAALIAVNVGGLRERLFGARGPARIQSLAVLPLENLSRDPEQEYFADGMTEELIADISQISALRVISRTSVMEYKGAKKPLPEIARALNVDALVEGSVLRSGDRVRITAQLIEAKSDRHLWAKSYERDLKGVLALQSEVAAAIAQEINVRLSPREKALLARARPVNPAAHEAYLRGVTEDDPGKSLHYFQQALQLDPTYAPTYAGLARAYYFLGLFGVLPPQQAFSQTREAAQKALQLDETLADAHGSLALVKLHYDWDWAAAEKEFQRALELNPSQADVRDDYAHFLMVMNRQQEWVAESQRAVTLNPFDPSLNSCLAWHHLCAGQYDLAVAQSRKVLQAKPDYWWALINLGWAYEQKGMYPEAIAQFERSFTEWPGSSLALAGLAHTYGRAGRKQDAMKVLAQLQEKASQGFVPAYDLASVYAGFGDTEQAFAWLDKAYRERSAFLVHIRWDPKFAALHSDPRFQELVRRIGLPP